MSTLLGVGESAIQSFDRFAESYTKIIGGMLDLSITPQQRHQNLADYYGAITFAKERLADYDLFVRGLDIPQTVAASATLAKNVRSLEQTIKATARPQPFRLTDHWKKSEIEHADDLLNLVGTRTRIWSDNEYTAFFIPEDDHTLYGVGDPMPKLLDGEVRYTEGDEEGVYVTPPGVDKRLRREARTRGFVTGLEIGFAGMSLGVLSAAYWDLGLTVMSSSFAAPVVGGALGLYIGHRTEPRIAGSYAFRDLANILEKVIPQLADNNTRIQTRREDVENAPDFPMRTCG